MEDIRIETMPYVHDGKTYQLCCNFNVLADLEQEYGSIIKMLNRTGSLSVTRSALAYMLNDYADQMGWPERFTPRQIGRELKLNAEALTALTDKIIGLVLLAVKAKPVSAESAEKN